MPNTYSEEIAVPQVYLRRTSYAPIGQVAELLVRRVKSAEATYTYFTGRGPWEEKRSYTTLRLVEGYAKDHYRSNMPAYMQYAKEQALKAVPIDFPDQTRETYKRF